MRRLLTPAGWVAAALAGLLGLGCAAVVDPGPGRGPGQGQSKVLVCHKGKKTLEVAEAALAAHLKHGDARGRCR